MDHKYKLSSLLAACLLLTSCSDEIRIGQGDDENGRGDYETYLQLTVRCPEATGGSLPTRSNPTGGEKRRRP